MLKLHSKQFLTCVVVAGLLLVGVMSIMLFASSGTARAAEVVKLAPSLSGEVPCGPVSKTALGLKDTNNRWHCYTGTGSVPGASAPRLPGTIVDVCSGSHHVRVTYITGSNDTAHSDFGPGHCDSSFNTSNMIVQLVEVS